MEDTKLATKKTETESLSFKKLLVALELSKVDDSILAYLDFMTKAIPIEEAAFLHVLPEREFLDLIYEDKNKAISLRHSLGERINKEIELKVKTVLSAKKSINFSFGVRDGNPLEELMEEAITQESDLLVIGQKEKPAQHGILAKNLARRVKSNALIIPQNAKKEIKKILVPIDFSSNAVRAFKMALALRKTLKEPSEIICLNVYDMPNLSAYKIGRTLEQLRNAVKATRKEAFENFLNTYAQEEGVETVLIEREFPGVASYIIDFANQNNIDFVVMGAKGHSKIDLLLMGSITEKVLNLNEDIPIMVVK